MLVHHRGNHGGARAKDGGDGGGGFAGRGDTEGGGGSRGGEGGGRVLEQISVLQCRPQLRLWRKPWTEMVDKKRKHCSKTNDCKIFHYLKKMWIRFTLIFGKIYQIIIKKRICPPSGL